MYIYAFENSVKSKYQSIHIHINTWSILNNIEVNIRIKWRFKAWKRESAEEQ